MSVDDISLRLAAMGRWEPGAGERLRTAAMELYLERGYEQTTVSDIADRAGVTARTFFRHYADKREVLFAGSQALQEALLASLEGAPATAGPLDAVAAALEVVATTVGQHRSLSRMRQTVIAANAELRERELIKMAAWATALADGLRRRGVPEPTASLAAEAGVAVFRVAFEGWLAESAEVSLAQVMDEAMSGLRALAVG